MLEFELAAALRDQLVHHFADGGIGGQATGGVGPAALRADEQLAQRAGHAPLFGQTGEHFSAGFNGVFDRVGCAALFLDDEARDGAPALAHCFLQLPRRKTLAAEADHQHRADVGVRAESFERTGRQFKIKADLRTAYGMADRHRTGQLGGNALHRAIGAEHGGNDGQMVAYAHRSV